eukprot:m.267902 g.267902  ORF g.267902 m.267902 type:complete len:470 (+) comp16251_c3_seq3:363-1772(+)
MEFMKGWISTITNLVTGTSEAVVGSKKRKKDRDRNRWEDRPFTKTPEEFEKQVGWLAVERAPRTKKPNKRYLNDESSEDEEKNDVKPKKVKREEDELIIPESMTSKTSEDNHNDESSSTSKPKRKYVKKFKATKNQFKNEPSKNGSNPEAKKPKSPDFEQLMKSFKTIPRTPESQAVTAPSQLTSGTTNVVKVAMQPVSLSKTAPIPNRPIALSKTTSISGQPMFLRKPVKPTAPPALTAGEVLMKANSILTAEHKEQPSEKQLSSTVKQETPDSLPAPPTQKKVKKKREIVDAEVIATRRKSPIPCDENPSIFKTRKLSTPTTKKTVKEEEFDEDDDDEEDDDLGKFFTLPQGKTLQETIAEVFPDEILLWERERFKAYRKKNFPILLEQLLPTHITNPKEIKRRTILLRNTIMRIGRRKIRARVYAKRARVQKRDAKAKLEKQNSELREELMRLRRKMLRADIPSQV